MHAKINKGIEFSTPEWGLHSCDFSVIWRSFPVREFLVSSHSFEYCPKKQMLLGQKQGRRQVKGLTGQPVAEKFCSTKTSHTVPSWVFLGILMLPLPEIQFFFYLWVFFWLQSKQIRLTPRMKSATFGTTNFMGLGFSQSTLLYLFTVIFFPSKSMLGFMPANFFCGFFFVSKRFSEVWGYKAACGFLLGCFLTPTLWHSNSPFSVSLARTS